MKKIYLAVNLLLIYTVTVTQNLVSITACTDLFISTAAEFSSNGLSLSPSAGFAFNGVTLSKKTTVLCHSLMLFFSKVD